MPDVPNRPPHLGADSERDLRFDGFSAPPAGAEQKVPTLSDPHTHDLAAGSQIAVLAGALGNSITNQEHEENKEKEKI